MRDIWANIKICLSTHASHVTKDFTFGQILCGTCRYVVVPEWLKRTVPRVRVSKQKVALNMLKVNCARVFPYTVKPVFKTTWEIGTAWEWRTATSVRRPIQCIEMDLRNKTTSEFGTVFDSPLGVPNLQVQLYYVMTTCTCLHLLRSRFMHFLVLIVD